MFAVPWLLSCRVALALVGFLGFVNLYALRVNLSVAMVCMINRTALAKEDSLINTTGYEIIPDKCYVQPEANATVKVNDKLYKYRCPTKLNFVICT